MRKFIILLTLLCLCALPVRGAEYIPPAAPEAAEEHLPPQSGTFGEDLWYVIKSAIYTLSPSIREAVGVCVSLIALTLLLSVVKTLPGVPARITALAGTVAVGAILISPSGSLIRLGADTVMEMHEYGKLLTPVLTGAMAAQGGFTASTTLYAGTVVFNSLLSTCVTKLIIPMIYVYMALAVAGRAIGEDILGDMKSFVKWLMTWGLKIVLYVFTGYMTVTGVVSGTTDAAAMKATKIAINGMVPVVGSIVSDASESILVSAGVMKNAVGVYGFLVIFALWITPFLKIGLQYLFLKATAGICAVFGTKETSALIKDFASVMGLLLAMTGTVCLMLLISTVCFMKGVS